ncbi:GntR family transcriptional regulator [Pseudonocardia abyssalis]|uniref:GntR family transcriptional regulator n=1 Tax=Pseudonocardia abyssalis TaxID=2792008 RepID=A0ABS6UVX6_9PSEU|nr:GntR family transcriptional regulator [Pseudonocardia abyssalis]MBW0115676.1 GntR family transcriptional regulator [Pseudonocardia abyssalis]MBW0136428.1 GntR family transcriptional regulator [Pseudonocardia abyssalis]
MDLTDLEPVERRSTAAIVADRIRTAIMRGTFPPGTQLGEVELATRLGVSRGPLREAMQRLVAEGLLRSERHRGLFVRDLDAADVRDIYHARASVERAAGLLLLDGDRAGAADRLDDALAAMATAVAAGDPAAIADSDHAFHAELVAASGSPRLRRMADGLLVETRMCLAALQQTAPPPEGLLAEHRELCEAVRAGDRDRLTAALEAHMADAVTRLLAPVAVTTATQAPAPPA